MSYLAKPRIGFFSTDAMTNPSTANNENIVHLLDYDNVVLLNPPAVQGPQLPRMSDASYREWMTSLITYADAPPQDPTQPDWQPGMPGYWNYWGDHLTTFGSATVTSSWIGNDPIIDPSGDPLIGANVVFNARIVDLNPADTFCSQFVAAGFSVIGRDRDGANVELLRGVPTTSVTRWLNFFRFFGAGTFQAVIPNSDLTFVDPSRAPQSPGLQALRDGAQQGGGLLIRWCFYGMQTQKDMLELYDSFQQGAQATNPKVGRVVGSIGVWNGTDMISTPVGRIMQQPVPPYFPAPPGAAAAPGRPVKTHADVERVAAPGASPETTADQSMGPAAAVVSGGLVLLDLNTAFPEVTCVDQSPPDPWDKYDFGTVNLELVYDTDAGTQTPVLGSVDYQRQAYEQLGGVWEVPFDPASEAGQHITDGWLQLRDQAGNVLLKEVPVVQVATDDQAVYLDLVPADGGLRAEGRARLRVFDKGEPLAQPITLTVERWNDVQVPGTVNSTNPLVLTATQITETQAKTFQVEVPAGGQVDVPIEADVAACYKLRYIAPGMAATSSPNWAVEYFSCFRVLPYDDFSHVPDDEVTFDLVYETILNYYAILYPVMSTIIPWGPRNTPHDPDRVAQFAALMRHAIDESRLGTALEMPITRELSAGKRALLRRWCDLQLQG